MPASKKERVFSGIQPSGNVHIGNYLGAIKRWVDEQDRFDNIFCIVDLHAITVPQDPKALRNKICEVAALLVAAGINPQHSPVFVQSHISAHAELAWILNCITPMGWMERMIQYKEKSSANKERVSVGLFDYPALMAADILLYRTDLVPVGEDQQQHVELARDIAQRFNNIYGETFVLPRAVVPAQSSRIMGLDNPAQKMSKSSGGAKHAVSLLDSPKIIRAKIMSAATDSRNEIRFDATRPGIYNLLLIYEQFSARKRADIEREFSGKGYAELKNALADLLIRHLEPLQARYKELRSDERTIESIVRESAERIRPLAEKTLQTVKEKMGLG